MAVVVSHSLDIEPHTSLLGNDDVLIGELSAVWNISFGTGENSVSETDVDRIFIELLFKLL